MALVPTDKVVEITLDYLANDPELNEAFDYIQPQEFPKIHKFVGYLKEHKDVSAFMCVSINPQFDNGNICSVWTGGWIALFQCFKFINDHGLDVYAIYNHIQDFFDFPPFQPTNTTRTGVGIHGFVDDVIAVLPLDDLKALFHKKTETREFFKNLVEAVKSPGFVVSINGSPIEYRHLLHRLCDYLCVNSCGECITSSHRTWWNLCEPGKYTRESGQNTREWSRPYNKRVVMWIVSSNSSGNNLCEVQFSILGNVTGIPWFFFFCSYAQNFLMPHST